jgi:hypothetical protein
MIQRLKWVEGEGPVVVNDYEGATLALARSARRKWIIVWDGHEPQKVLVDTGVRDVTIDDVPSANAWLRDWAFTSYRKSTIEDVIDRRVSWRLSDGTNIWGYVVRDARTSRGSRVLSVDTELLGLVRVNRNYVHFIDRTIPDETRDEYTERLVRDRAFWVPLRLSPLGALHSELRSEGRPSTTTDIDDA